MFSNSSKKKKIEEEGTFPNTILKAKITLLPKPDKDITREENYRPMPLVHIDAKTLTKILQNQMLQFVKRIRHVTKWDLFKGCKWILSQ